MANIKFYDILMHRAGGISGSHMALLRGACKMQELGFTVYVGIDDIIMAEMKHITYGWLKQMGWFVDFVEKKESMKPGIVFFNESRIADSEYRYKVFSIDTKPSVQSVLIATPKTVHFLQGAEVFDNELANTSIVILLCDWDGKIPHRGHQFLNDGLFDELTVRGLTQSETPTLVFLEMFQYGTMIISDGDSVAASDPTTLPLVSMIHDTFGYGPTTSSEQNKEREFSICLDVKTDTLLIQENDPPHYN